MHYFSFFSGTIEPDMMKLCKLKVLKVNDILKQFGVGWVTSPNSDLHLWHFYNVRPFGYLLDLIIFGQKRQS